jgi:hypothetical protein
MNCYCGCALKPDFAFCPSCGRRNDSDIVAVQPLILSNPYNRLNVRNNAIISPVISIIVGLILDELAPYIYGFKDNFGIIIFGLIGIILIIIVIEQELFRRPVEIVLYPNGLMYHYWKFKEDRFLPWQNIRGVELFSGRKRYRGTKLKKTNIYESGRSFPAFATYENGLKIIEYANQLGTPIKKYEIN